MQIQNDELYFCQHNWRATRAKKCNVRNIVYSDYTVKDDRSLPTNSYPLMWAYVCTSISLPIVHWNLTFSHTFTAASALLVLVLAHHGICVRTVKRLDWDTRCHKSALCPTIVPNAMFSGQLMARNDKFKIECFRSFRSIDWFCMKPFGWHATKWFII